jgi:hypothetical protein
VLEICSIITMSTLFVILLMEWSVQQLAFLHYFSEIHLAPEGVFVDQFFSRTRRSGRTEAALQLILSISQKVTNSTIYFYTNSRLALNRFIEKQVLSSGLYCPCNLISPNCGSFLMPGENVINIIAIDMEDEPIFDCGDITILHGIKESGCQDGRVLYI